MENGYPKKLIMNTIRNTLANDTKRTDDTEKESKQYVAIPYANGLFEKIAPIFKGTGKKIVGRGGNNLQRSVFTRVKDTVPKMQKSHVVYNIPCSCDECYVGETRNRLKHVKMAINTTSRPRTNHTAHCATMC